MISEYVADDMILNNLPYTRYRGSALVSEIFAEKPTETLQRILPMIVNPWQPATSRRPDKMTPNLNPYQI